jgi:hypothetical protein
MPTYESPGTANLRANESIKAGKQTESPSGSGKDCGGTANLKADQQTKQAKTKTTTTYSADHRPAGLQTFRDGV